MLTIECWPSQVRGTKRRATELPHRACLRVLSDDAFCIQVASRSRDIPRRQCCRAADSGILYEAAIICVSFLGSTVVRCVAGLQTVLRWKTDGTSQQCYNLTYDEQRHLPVTAETKLLAGR